MATVIWEALRKKHKVNECNVWPVHGDEYKVLPVHRDEYKVLPVEKDDLKEDLESSDEEFLSEVRDRHCQSVETIIP